jgi:hypothetical protein
MEKGVVVVRAAPQTRHPPHCCIGHRGGGASRFPVEPRRACPVVRPVRGAAVIVDDRRAR